MRPLENLPVSLWSSGTREAEPFPMLSAPGLVAATVPEILAIWEDRTKQLIDPNHKTLSPFSSSRPGPVKPRDANSLATAVFSCAKRAAPRQFQAGVKTRGARRIRRRLGLTDRPSRSHRLCRQASRRYRRNATPLPAPAPPHPSALQGLRLLHNG
jgi:hypothetical protein